MESGFITVSMSSRLLTFLHHTKEEERLGFLVVLVWEKLCLSWNLSTMSQKLMVCFCYNNVKAWIGCFHLLDVTSNVTFYILTGGFSVFAGVGERTREGNDLYREMIESGVIKLGDKQVILGGGGGVGYFRYSSFVYCILGS